MNICEIGRLAETHGAEWLPENGAIINCESEEEARSLAPLLYKDVDFSQLEAKNGGGAKGDDDIFRETLGEKLARLSEKERGDWIDLFEEIVKDNMTLLERVVARARDDGKPTELIEAVLNLDRHTLAAFRELSTGGAK